MSTKDFLALDMTRRYIRTINIPSLRNHKVMFNLFVVKMNCTIRSGPKTKGGLECPLEGIYAPEPSHQGRSKVVLQIF